MLATLVNTLVHWGLAFSRDPVATIDSIELSLVNCLWPLPQY